MTLFDKLFSSAQWLLLSAAVLFSSTALAELRVLIKFDEAAHRVHRLVEVESTIAELTESQPGLSASEQSVGEVSVLWLDATGAVLRRERMSDPRVTHAPLLTAEASPTFVGVTDGAYMVSGPTGSVILEIQLPANDALALHEQTWQFELNR